MPRKTITYIQNGKKCRNRGGHRVYTKAPVLEVASLSRSIVVDRAAVFSKP
jgi:hypothetical protein